MVFVSSISEHAAGKRTTIAATIPTLNVNPNLLVAECCMCCIVAFHPLEGLPQSESSRGQGHAFVVRATKGQGE